jgi:hypothetical protein
MKRATFILTFLIAAVVAIAVSHDDALAIPAFAKKYDAPCSLCHEKWPRLSDVGMKFKLNGFQMPDTEDGGQTAKLSPKANLFLDIGDANLPISVILDGGIVLKQPGNGPGDPNQNDTFYCCTEGSDVTLAAGGTVAPNIAYYISLPWGKENASQAYLRFSNLFSPGLLGVDIGAMKVIDNDVNAPGREWFGLPDIAYFGSPYNGAAQAVGMTAAANDTGVRFAGRPGYDVFSYEVGVFTGARMIGAGQDDSDLAYTFMGRMDFEKFALSLRYWNNKSAQIDQTVTLADGTVATFAADRTLVDESTTDLIVSARYRHPSFSVDVTVDRGSFNVSDRTTVIDGTTHTYGQGTITRLGASAGIIWYASDWFQTGVSYGVSRYEDSTRTVDEITESVEGVQVGLVQWRMEARPVANMRLGLELQIDMSDSAARTNADGTDFDPQNKVVLQWDMAI